MEELESNDSNDIEIDVEDPGTPSRTTATASVRTDGVSSDDRDANEEEDEDDDLPPILAPPSTGYFHTVNANQPPPKLHAIDDDSDNEPSSADASKLTEKAPVEVIDLGESDEGATTTTDSDDDLVNVNYFKNPPEGFQKALKKYSFAVEKDLWIFNIKKFYHSQPTRIKRLLKMHKDVDGNPIEEPIEMLFEKIHAERERMRKAQNIKCERGEDPDGEVGPATLHKFKVSSSDTSLTHVMYPGNVVNPEKAIATLGGIGTISRAFDNPTKKLALKFRPNDPFTNAANGLGRATCGILLLVRRRKTTASTSQSAQSGSSEESKKINLDTLGKGPVPVDVVHNLLLDCRLKKSDTSDESITINYKEYKQQDILREDQILMEEKMRECKTKKAFSSAPAVSSECSLKIPKILETMPDTNTEIGALGIVRRTYEFNGICDFQYLPMTKKHDGSYASIKDKIFPMFGTKDNPEKLVIKALGDSGSNCRLFGLPPVMSRIDMPPRGLIDDLILSEKAPAKVVPTDDSIYSSRSKRLIYTISYNFQNNPKEKRKQVPSQPLSMALTDIEKRQIEKDQIDLVQFKFEERPIWSKLALEYATKIPSQILKYIIPRFAYFAANGPWRNTWIKFGVDPRDDPINVLFQSVDFRVPFLYRKFMNSNDDNPPEIACCFLPKFIPTKAQMFYQLCDIKLDEISELIETLKRKAKQHGALKYDERYGFLKDGSFEYFRYIMTYYLENLLLERGKIMESNAPSVTFVIPPGSIEPEEKLKAAPLRRLKQKRMRKSNRKAENRSLKIKEQQAKGGTTARSNLEMLADLELNKLPTMSDGDEDSEEEDDSMDE